MNTSILDVDELLRDDSFMPLVEDEVLNTATYYLKQWKEKAEELESNVAVLNTTVTIPESRQHVDTRTFQRPKRQQQPHTTRPILNETLTLSQSPKGSPGFHPQIGGLVTRGGVSALPITMTQSSMQKSLIGDTSPPSSICSSTIDLAAERLGHNETYANVNNCTVAAETLSSLNGFNMDDVRREIEMLQNLTFEEGEKGLREDGIENNATVLISKEGTEANGTFDLIGDEGVTLAQTMIIPGRSNVIVEESAEQNSTFNLTKLIAAPCDQPREEDEALKEHAVLIRPATEEGNTLVDEEDIHLEFVPGGIDTFIQSTPICRDKTKHQADIFNFSPTGNDEMYRTIERNMKNTFKLPALPQRFLERTSTTLTAANVDELADEKEVQDEKTIQERRGQQLQTDQSPADEYQSSPELEDVPEIRQREPVPVDMLRPEERQSLVNFEEYEKSLQLLDDNRNEREFDDMLASINTVDMRRSTEKMRQSLDSIKKRHSLINYERQQEELRKKVNDIDQEINNLTMGESGGGGGGSARLLNRRSRLFEEKQLQEQANEEKNNIMNRTMDLNTTNTLLEQKEATVAERRSVPDKRDRDRFKTIKIFRKTLNSNIPDADETSVEGNLEEDQQDEQVPEPVQMLEPPPAAQQRPQRMLQRPSRILTRPKFTSGLQRPSHLGVTAQKASSADDLLDSSRRGDVEEDADEQREVSEERRGQSVQRTMNPSRLTVGKLKSPMGIKSKSIHNLMMNGAGQSRIGTGVSRIGGGGGDRQQEMRPFSTNTFKVGNKAGGVMAAGYGTAGTYQRPAPASGVMMRPAKPISGVQRPVSAVIPSTSATMNRPHDNFHQEAEKVAEVRSMAPPRTTGLRPPSGIARPTTGGATRSGLPRLSSIPRR